jgi:hypothetical protein
MSSTNILGSRVPDGAMFMGTLRVAVDHGDKHEGGNHLPTDQGNVSVSETVPPVVPITRK